MTGAREDAGGDRQEPHVPRAIRSEGGPRRRGRGRGGGGGGGNSSRSRLVQISCTLAKLLRHKASSEGIALDDEGFAPLEQVIAWQPLRALDTTFAEVQSIVANDVKQRYALKLKNPSSAQAASDSSSSSSTNAADYLIRANQGHSLSFSSTAHLESLCLTAGNVPPVVVHGTYFAFWPAIEADGGLRPMTRAHVHCAAALPEDKGVSTVSGMRADAELAIFIDVEASLRAGLPWWRSENGVLLTDGGADGLLPTRFFKEVVGRKLDVGVLWKNGVKKADLPEGLKARIPRGKEPWRNGSGSRQERGRGVPRLQ